MAASTSHTLAVRTDGALWAWGSNSNGQVGSTQLLPGVQPVPARISTATTWASVSASERHTVAMRTDGTLWAWGNNTFGQLGDGTTAGHSAPVQAGHPY
ncbi:hypothetical protein LRS06_22220 [Hymenobacter sp. J193]|uniref:hypothetical protein n=1 Tax=Hymenobacter sp. J193 TaxID=2898429 RepID=UPI0021519182|nr:hypothetical protein [Hymenobacter sp. J193]MCR5890447.1 hypothetical protein [Hymenobacter sp. J193]